MITLDRDAPLSVGEQLVEQLRYQVAAGQYRPGDRLPSTRALGDQVGVSFHTVRKAYQRLADENVLEVRRGGGYFVSQPAPLSTADRMERGSATVQDALQKLVALGLDEEEMDYVVQEQLAYFERPGTRRTLLFAGPYRELAEAGAEQASAALQERVEPVLVADLRRHAGADAVLTPLAALQTVRRAVPKAEVVGVDVRFPYDTLEQLARRMPSETVALVTRSRDGTAPIEAALREPVGLRRRVPRHHDRRRAPPHRAGRAPGRPRAVHAGGAAARAGPRADERAGARRGRARPHAGIAGARAAVRRAVASGARGLWREKAWSGLVGPP